MKYLNTILFVAYQSILIYLDAVNVLEFSFPYAIVSALLLINSAYKSYLKSQEIPRLNAEISKRIAAQDQKLTEIKSELSRYSITKVQNQGASAFKF